MQLGFSKNLIENILDDVFDVILNSLKDNGKVKITNFGTFILRHKKSRMGRVFGVCEVINIEINRELVEKGFALARRKQTKDYVKYEKIAKKNELGIWQSEFIKPWDWRKRYNVPRDP